MKKKDFICEFWIVNLSYCLGMMKTRRKGEDPRYELAFTNVMLSQVSDALLGRFTIKSDKERTFFKGNKPLGW